MCGSIPKVTLTSFFSSWVSLIVARFKGPEGLQDPEGLALGLAPVEDLVQGPTGPEGPTPGYKFYWPEVVVVGETGTVSSCTGVFMV